MIENLKPYKSYILLLLTFIGALITYGYSLGNFSLSVDNETPIIPDFSLHLGRWGTNLVRYHLFGNLLPYFTLLFSLFFLSLSSVIITSIFKLNFLYALIFSILFISLPQLAYQMVFLMQSDAIALGYLASSFALVIYIKKFLNNNSIVKWIWFFLAALLIMFVIACYQGLFLVPIVTYLAYIFSIANQTKLTIKEFIFQILKFSGLIILGVALYYISIKTVFIMDTAGNFEGYTSGDSNNLLNNFVQVLWSNLKGTFYYGDQLYFLAPLAGSGLIIYNFIKPRINHFINIICILGLLIIPFIISLPITNGYHPPRLYISSGISFSILIVYFLKIFDKTSINFWVTTIVGFINIFFITNLYYSNHKVFEHDVRIAERISREIRTKFPEAPTEQIVYFHGAVPMDNLNHVILPNSEIFGGSMFNWDNGNNYRIVSFYSFLNIDQFQLLNDIKLYHKVEPNIADMPIWPKEGSIQMFENVVVVKLSQEKGSPLPCEY